MDLENRDGFVVDKDTECEIASALSESFECIFYVNLSDGSFAEFNGKEIYRRYGLPKSGDDFFSCMKGVILSCCNPSDKLGCLDFFSREKLTFALQNAHSTSKVFNLRMDGVDVCFRARACKRNLDSTYMVLSVENLDGKVGDNLKQEEFRIRNINSMMQLSNDLVAVFDVSLASGKYELFVNRKSKAVPFEVGHYYRRLFYSDMSEHALRDAYDNDKKALSNFYSQSFIQETLGESREAVLEYRFNEDDGPKWFRSKIVPNTINGQTMFVVGVYDIDEQIKRDSLQKARINELMEQSSKDSLTGVKNKNAYILQESILNRQIQSKTDLDFAVVVCDVNELKRTNDFRGHEMGDEILKDAAELICSTFKRSPVYRIGGDEFAVIVSKNDMERRFELVEKLQKCATVNAQYSGVVVASGISDYLPTDQCVADVFCRADREMYSNKSYLKQLKNSQE